MRRILAGLVLAAAIGTTAACQSTAAVNSTPVTTPAPAAVAPSTTALSLVPTTAVVPEAAPPTTAQTLSNDNSYVNSSGNVVQSPAYTSNGQPPPGATAQCGDGTYSFSQHRSGTCSHHGGVARWL
jgi:hypothetical protein